MGLGVYVIFTPHEYWMCVKHHAVFLLWIPAGLTSKNVKTGFLGQLELSLLQKPQCQHPEAFVERRKQMLEETGLQLDISGISPTYFPNFSQVVIVFIFQTCSWNMLGPQSSRPWMPLDAPRQDYLKALLMLPAVIQDRPAPVVWISFWKPCHPSTWKILRNTHSRDAAMI